MLILLYVDLRDLSAGQLILGIGRLANIPERVMIASQGLIRIAEEGANSRFGRPLLHILRAVSVTNLGAVPLLVFGSMEDIAVLITLPWSSMLTVTVTSLPK